MKKDCTTCNNSLFEMTPDTKFGVREDPDTKFGVREDQGSCKMTYYYTAIFFIR